MTTIPAPSVLLVLDHDLGDVTRADIDDDAQDAERDRLYDLVAFIRSVIDRVDDAREREELYAKLEAFKERGDL